ncbi:MAG: hypothetical protein KZQ97_12610 [Candidatus Thiodiazotropha sp. (ex Dulcina madagascariensis)]|nr:hypothetical protein [Candidatus Thiodiazotropha sp. (ex Dulcina madagascariensis)]
MNKIDTVVEKCSMPKQAVGRWINTIMLILVSLGSFTSFYIIRFHLCGSFECKDLKITGIFYLFSPAFMVFGALVLIVSAFIKKEKDLPSIYSDSITASLVFAMLLMLFIPFGVSIEIGKFN